MKAQARGVSEKRSYIVDETLAGRRLDAALALLAVEFTRSYLVKLIESERVFVNGRAAVKSLKITQGDEIVLVVPEIEELDCAPENIPLDIVYEDECLLVVCKPKGMVVHPAPGHPAGTLVNALLCHCKGCLSGIGGVARPGIVHRIDRDTSGLLIVAKTDEAHHALAQQIAAHSFLREYQAVVYGNVRQDTGTVDAPIGRHPSDRKRMAVTQRGGKRAVTHYEVLARYGAFTHLRCRLETGRTHQIRVHMAYIGHPVAGDPVYGPKKVIEELAGQCLHAKVIGFIHPATGECLRFDSALPPYFTDFLRKIGGTGRCGPNAEREQSKEDQHAGFIADAAGERCGQHGADLRPGDPAAEY